MGDIYETPPTGRDLLTFEQASLEIKGGADRAAPGFVGGAIYDFPFGRCTSRYDGRSVGLRSNSGEL